MFCRSANKSCNNGPLLHSCSSPNTYLSHSLVYCRIQNSFSAQLSARFFHHQRLPDGKWVDFHPNLSDVLKGTSSGAPQLRLHIVPPCYPTSDEEGCSISLSFPGAQTSIMSRDSDFRPNSLCSSIGNPKRQELITGLSSDASCLLMT